MTKSNDPIRIELTEEQKNQVKEVTGTEASAIELTAEDLEARAMPRKISPTSPSWEGSEPAVLTERDAGSARGTPGRLARFARTVGSLPNPADSP